MTRQKQVIRRKIADKDEEYEEDVLASLYEIHFLLVGLWAHVPMMSEDETAALAAVKRRLDAFRARRGA